MRLGLAAIFLTSTSAFAQMVPTPAPSPPASGGAAQHPQSGDPDADQAPRPPRVPPSEQLATPDGSVPRRPSFALRRPLRLDTVIGLPVADGCEYLANVRGELRPAPARRNQPRAASVAVDLQLSLTCPGVAYDVTETVADTGPMSRGELERALERRATVVIEGSDKRCVYLPDFQLTDEDLVGVGVSRMCSPAPAAPSLRD